MNSKFMNHASKISWHFFTLVFVLSLFESASPFSSMATAAEEVDKSELTFCHFGPKEKVISPVYSKAMSQDGDGCTGSAKVQALMWKCGVPEETESTVRDFQKKLSELATEECAHHCQRRKSGCRGRLDPPPHCGLATDREDAVALGSRMHCRKDCVGQAFIYCSLYDAQFRTDDPPRIAKQAPNCHCSMSK